MWKFWIQGTYKNLYEFRIHLISQIFKPLSIVGGREAATQGTGGMLP
jgi:hypothetical protein